METQDLHTRLEALGAKLKTVEEKLAAKAHFQHDRAHLSAKELKDHYEQLQARLDEEEASEAAHGHHISNLERSVRHLLDSM